MAAAFVLPFFHMGGTGCAPSRPFPCESKQVRVAAERLLSDWTEKHGKLYDLEVVPFQCPDFSDLNDDERLVAPFSRRGSTACADFRYWDSRREQQAGRALHEKLVGEVAFKEPTSPTGTLRLPGQPDARLEVQCKQGHGSSAFDCLLTARLFLMPGPLDDAEPRRADATRTATVAFSLASEAAAVPLSQPGRWADALGRLVFDDPGIVALIKGGPTLDQWPYLGFVLLTVILGLLAWRGGWPRGTMVVAALALLTSGALIASCVADAAGFCRGYVAFAPHNRLVAIAETLFVDVKLGIVVFFAASAAATTAAVRGWWRGRRPPSGA